MDTGVNEFCISPSISILLLLSGLNVEETTNRCVCCKMKTNKKSYILPCGHSAHVNCYRKYSYTKKSMRCPDCNLFEVKDYDAKSEITNVSL